MKKILVTGSLGVAGSAFEPVREEYPDNEFKLIDFKDCNLTNKEETIDYIERYAPNAIIHLAALGGGIGLTKKYPATVMRNNILMNLNILEAARNLNLEKVVMTLSSGMYPPSAPIPLKEDYIHDGAPHSSNYGYSFAKRLIEPSIIAYREEYGLNVIGLVPNGIFGENDNFNEEDSTMLPALIRRFYENRNGNSEIVVWGDGTPLREYTYSKDVARSFMWCLNNYDGEQILNIGSTEENSVKDIAFMIADILDIDKKRIVFDTAKPMGVFKKSTDNSRFIQLSNFNYTPFREGLENTIKWYSDVYENSPDLLRTNSKIKVF